MPYSDLAVVLIPPGAYADTVSLGASLLARSLRRAGARAPIVDANRMFFRGLAAGPPGDLGPFALASGNVLDAAAPVGSVEELLRLSDPALLPPGLAPLFERLAGLAPVKGARAFCISVSLPSQALWAIVLRRALRARYPRVPCWIGGSSWTRLAETAPMREISAILGLRALPADGADADARRIIAQAKLRADPRPARAKLVLAGARRNGLIVFQRASGCAYARCAFCSYPNQSGPLLRPDSGRRDLRRLLRRYRPRKAFISDSYLTPSALLSLLDEVRGVDERVSVSCFARFDPGFSQPGLAAGLRRRGLGELYMGLESASPRVLALMDKGIDLSVASANIKALHAAGVDVGVSAIAGFPTETAEEFSRTLGFLRDHRPWLRRRPVIFPFKLHPGTPLEGALSRFGPLSPAPRDSILALGLEVEGPEGMSLAERDRLLEAANRELDELYACAGSMAVLPSLGAAPGVAAGARLA